MRRAPVKRTVGRRREELPVIIGEHLGILAQFKQGTVYRSPVARGDRWPHHPTQAVLRD